MSPRVASQALPGRDITVRATRSQRPDFSRESQLKAWGRQRARMTRSEGVSERQARRVMARPSATLGPVLEKSLKRVVPIKLKPTMTVPALVAIGSKADRRVCRMAAAGSSLGQCSANRQERKRQKSVPQPKRMTIRNSSTRGEISQPA